MIWLYLLVLVLSVVGLAVVVLEWRRGVRSGLLGPLSTFLLAFWAAVLALVWLHTLDGAHDREWVRSVDVTSTTEVKVPHRSSIAQRGTSVDPEPGTGVRPERPVRTRWRSVFTPDFIAGVLTTAVLTVLAQIQTTLTITRLHRSIEALQRRLR